MDIHIAVKEILAQYGLELIRDSKLVNYLADVNCFAELNSKKNILKEIISFFGARLLTLGMEMFIMWLFVTLLKLNSDTNYIGNTRQFIMVQLNEKCKESSEAAKRGYKTIDEIGQERIKRAANKIKAETNGNCK